MPLDVSTHASLLAKLRETGDASAWREFDDRYRELVFSFARRRGFQPADADDVAQETLSIVLRAIGRFEYDPNKGRFRGWLKTTALHVMMKHARPGVDALDRARDGTSVVGETPSDADADAAWEVEWRRYHIRVATAKVRGEFNGKDFMAFERCTVGGESASDVATALGLSVDSIYQAKSRILRRLREHVESQVAEEG